MRDISEREQEEFILSEILSNRHTAKLLAPVAVILAILAALHILSLILQIGMVLVGLKPESGTSEYTQLNFIYNIVIRLLGFAFAFFFVTPRLGLKKEDFGWFRKARPVLTIRAWATAFTTITILTFFAVIVWLFLVGTEPSLESPYEDIFLVENPINILLMFLMLSIAAPLFEETVFRGILIPLLDRQGVRDWTNILLSGLMFALIHVEADVMAGSPFYIILHLTSTFLLGSTLGFVFIKTQSLKAPILLHMVNNAFAGLGSLGLLSSQAGQNDSLIFSFLYLELAVLIVGGYSMIRFRNELRNEFTVLIDGFKRGLSKYSFLLVSLEVLGLIILPVGIQVGVVMSFDPIPIVFQVGTLGISLTSFLLLILESFLFVVGGFVILKYSETLSTENEL